MAKAAAEKHTPTAFPQPAVADSVVLGMGLMFVSVFIAPLIDVFSKLATAHLPAAEIALLRFVFQSLFMLPVVLWRGSWRQFGWRLTLYNMVRGALVTVTMVAFVTALAYMAIADAIAIFFVEPIILTIMGGLFLKEAIGWRRYLACAVGFFGAIMIVRPSFEEIGWVALLPIVAAFSFALFALTTRVLANRQDPWAMQLQTGLFGGLFCGLLLLAFEGSGSAVFDPVLPNATALLQALGVGFWATASGIIAVYAYRYAPASTLAPLQYFEIVCATLFGWLVFGDLPDLLKWTGIAIIIASGLFILWRERQEQDRLSARAAETMNNP